MSAQQLPPGRPWFRLASLARTEAASASAASNNPPPPLPRIPVPRLQQQPPPATLLAAPDQPPPLQTSLQPPPPPDSPKVISPSYSTPPPSIGQKPNPEPEQPKNNTVPEQGKILNGKERNKINGKAKEEEEKRLITIAGKNIGAKMEFGLGSMSEERNNGEEKAEDLTVRQAKQKRLVVNSNVQSINNSIVLNATCKQHSPGVHVNFARARQLKGSQANEKYRSIDE
ncbi:uncharacterized protein LOC110103499 [Dendrobium catenatum]|uniref:uncharacterized protein LOC110103499 n=1 Tax=Dendrobium catenatum TaxID=906689 RepID=UPI0009F2ED94|nr:uncharacterized protein LOC110103499 [Dendrobium catenatum]